MPPTRCIHLVAALYALFTAKYRTFSFVSVCIWAWGHDSPGPPYCVSSQEPNIVPYQLFMNSTKNSAAYLLRQYFTYNLADRLSTYPTPTDIEKRWICYQLLCALEQAHAKGICHGTSGHVQAEYGCVECGHVSTCTHRRIHRCTHVHFRTHRHTHTYTLTLALTAHTHTARPGTALRWQCGHSAIICGISARWDRCCVVQAT